MPTDFVNTALFSRVAHDPVRQYRLVVKPDEEVTKKITTEQQALRDEYDLNQVIMSKPHITVAAFSAREEMEETLIRWIHRICGLHESFPVTLNNYSGFPPHTVYLRIADQEPFLQLANQLKALNDFVDTASAIKYKPHLAIAANLPEKIYDKMMACCSQRLLHASFIASELILLKMEHAADAAKIINVFHFLSIGQLSCSKAG